MGNARFNWLILAAVVPGLAALVMATWTSYRRERADLEQSMLYTARTLSEAVDREVFGAQATLEALAVAGELDRNRLSSFHRKARQVVDATGIGDRITLSDAAGRPILDTSVDFGAELPVSLDPERPARTLRSGHPLVSDLIETGPKPRLQLWVDVPVMRDGAPAFDLGMLMRADRLSRILAAQNLPSDWVASVIDPRGINIAPSHNYERVLGRKAPAGALAAMARGQEGVGESESPEAIGFIGAYRRSEMTGFAVAVGFPVSELYAQMGRTTALTTLGVAVMLLASSLLAWRAGGPLLRAVRQLSSAAARTQDGGAGAELPMEGSGEVAELAHHFDRLSKARRDSEEALRLSEQMLRMATRASMIGIYSEDPVSGALYWSPELRAILGWGVDEPIPADALNKIVHPDDRYRLAIAMRRARDPGGDGKLELEYRIIRRDGQVRWVSAKSRTEFAGEGDQRHRVRRTGTLQDISERKHGELLLRESEQKLRGLFALSPLGIALTDMNGRFVEFNEAFRSICGYPDEELRALDYWKLTPREYEAAEQRQLASLRQTGKYGPYEKEYVRKDGTRVALVLNGVLVRGSDGADYIWSIVEDITERQRSQEQLRKLSQAVEQCPQSIFITDTQPCIEYANGAFMRNSGYRFEEVVGRDPSLLNSGHTPRKNFETLWEAMKQGLTWRGEFYNRRKNGSEYIDFSIVTPVRQADGRITHYLAIQEDITERKRMGAELDRHRHHLQEIVHERTVQLNEARLHAEAASRAKSQFLANMSHEIRTPLNALTGMGYLIRGDGVTERQARWLDQMELASAHLLAIISDILDLSKIEAGKLTLQQEPVDVPALVRSVASMLGARIRESVQLQVQTEDMSQPLWGDATRIKQALLNYGDNAAKFTEHGTIVLRAGPVSRTGDEVLLRFEVQDTGMGIAPEALERLFELFEQADASTTRRFGGTGLGLAVTKRLAQLMGGETGASSTPGAGSTFWFTARLGVGARPPTEAEPARRAPSAERQLQRGHQGRRLLLVEDDPVTREVTSYLLRHVGLDVDEAQDGLQALQRVTDSTYDLILMDMQMPGLDGPDAARAIRALPGRQKVPIVALTANVFREDRERCLAAGMSDFLSKPVQPEVLYSTLLRWLGPAEQSPFPSGH